MTWRIAGIVQSALLLAASAIVLCLPSAALAQTGVRECPPGAFSDEFHGPLLAATKWTTVRGHPVFRLGSVTLAGAEIRSRALFTRGCLAGIVDSSDWKPQGLLTDSTMHYRRFTLELNGERQPHELAIVTDAVTVDASEPERLAAAIQVDGNADADPYEVFIDQVEFTRRPLPRPRPPAP